MLTVGGDLPAAARGGGNTLDAGFSVEGDAEALGVGGDGGKEFGERKGGDAEAAALGGLEEGLVEDLAGVFGGAAVEAVVEGSEDDGLPEVADGAGGLVGAMEPGGEALGVVGGVAAKELGEAGGNACFIAQG